MFFLTKSPRRPAPRARLEVEALESRLVPYALTGNAWPHAELITLSFVPDGTVLAVGTSGNITSNLFAVFNRKFGSAISWQNQILKAAQTWAAQTNINFAVVADSGADAGSGSYQQGDPSFGDIRIGGFNFGTNTLASAFMPPPVNNYSIAGDLDINTAQTFNIGTTYDLFTVSLHEIGHALGLGHATTSSAVMYSAYNGTKTNLSSDDIAGIRALYSQGTARSPDAYDAAASNGSFLAATNITATIDATSKTVLLTNLDLTTTYDLDFYKFTAPSGSSSTMTLTVQSRGLSLLAPRVTVYAADQRTILGNASGLGQYGTTLTVTVNGVTAGQTYYVKVHGADTSVFGTGKYALTLNLGTGASPMVPLPNTQTANGNPLSGGGGIPNESTFRGDTAADANDVLNDGTTGSETGGKPLRLEPGTGETLASSDPSGEHHDGDHPEGMHLYNPDFGLVEELVRGLPDEPWPGALAHASPPDGLPHAHPTGTPLDQLRSFDAGPSPQSGSSGTAWGSFRSQGLLDHFGDRDDLLGLVIALSQELEERG
jgi:hypothetical protein